MIDQPIKNKVREVLEQLHILDLNLKPVAKDKSGLENISIITGVHVDSARFVINQAEDLIKILFSGNDPKNKLTYVQIRKALVAAINEHHIMRDSEYDRGFQYGMEHALYIIDTWVTGESQIAVHKITRRKRK